MFLYNMYRTAREGGPLCLFCYSKFAGNKKNAYLCSDL